MRRLLLIIVLSLFSCASFAQTPTLQQKLYYTCKIWGFVKYYHSNVSICNVNWDSVLLHILPLVRSATTSDGFNNALDTMLAAAGTMTLATTYFPDTLPMELKRNRDFSWISTPILRSDVQTQLDTIKNNFRPHANCWVVNNYGFGTLGYTGGVLAFPFDSVELNINTITSYPDQDHRLLMLFKYWNIIRYFNPYNYVLDASIDTVLFNFAIQISTAFDAESLYLQLLKIATSLNDAHVYGLTYDISFYLPPNGVYHPLIRLKYIGGEYVIVKSDVTGIFPGDAIISVDGLTTSQWEDSLRQYYSSGNISVFRRSVQYNLLNHYYGTNTTLVVEDSTGTNHTFILPCTAYSDTFFYNSYYPADSIDTISWGLMSCNIGYVNMGNLQIADVDSMYSDLHDKNAIIFDLRNYPNSTEGFIANLIFPNHIPFANLTFPDVMYPGTYYWQIDSIGVSGNPTPYTGKVIILMNEETQSQAEFSCMVLEAMPGAVKVGSQTAGADGAVTYWKLSQDLHVGFTNLGVYYPNGDSTQRIGIVPDSVVYPTRAGIRHHDDEVLNKAIQIACSTSLPKIANKKNTIAISPNPAYDAITINATGFDAATIVFQITDVTGNVLLQRTIENGQQKAITTFDISKLSAGIYFLSITADGQNMVRKFVKE